jgi:hypothetical protein
VKRSHEVAEVLKRDRNLRVELREYVNSTRPSRTIDKYTEGLRRIDLSGCPSDFQNAFGDYIAAVEKLGLRAGTVEGFGGFMKALFSNENLPAKVDEDSKRVHAAWYHVEKTAEKFGVTFEQPK